MQVQKISDDLFIPHTPHVPRNVYPKLPGGTYLLKFSMKMGWMFEVMPDMPLPPKLYGNTAATADKIINTFVDRKATTGVMLTGKKGTGKTLLSKSIISKLKEKDIPTLLVTQSLGERGYGCGYEAFGTLMQDLDQDMAIFVDEFEKVFKEDDGDQDGLLTLLDGIFTSKKLFLFTANSSSAVNDNLHDRPGRIYYWLKFQGLEMAAIREYTADTLKDKSKVDSVCRMARATPSLTFDMLQAVVEEVNRYGQSPSEALEMLNVGMETSYSQHEIKVYKNGTPVRLQEDRIVIHFNPYSPTRRSVNLYVESPMPTDAVNKAKPSTTTWQPALLASRPASAVPKDAKFGLFDNTLVFSFDAMVSEDLDEGIYTYNVEGYTIVASQLFPETHSDVGY